MRGKIRVRGRLLFAGCIHLVHHYLVTHCIVSLSMYTNCVVKVEVITQALHDCSRDIIRLGT